jgi:hypothetical protein
MKYTDPKALRKHDFPFVIDAPKVTIITSTKEFFVEHFKIARGNMSILLT